MNNIYYYFYYQVFKKVNRLQPNSKTPEFTAIILISFCETFNFLTIVFLLKNKSKMQILLLDFGSLVAIAILALNYLLLFYKGKSDKIVEYYQDRERNVFLEMMVAGYMISSFIVCGYLSTPVK